MTEAQTQSLEVPSCLQERQRLFARIRGDGFQLKECRFGLDIRENKNYCEGGEALAKDAQKRCECPILGLEELGLVEGDPIAGGLELNGL